MDKLDLILDAVKEAKKDNNDRCDRLEMMIEDKFEKLNGRVRKNENEILRIKAFWTAGVAIAGAAFHYLFG